METRLKPLLIEQTGYETHPVSCYMFLFFICLVRWFSVLVHNTQKVLKCNKQLTSKNIWADV